MPEGAGGRAHRAVGHSAEDLHGIAVSPFPSQSRFDVPLGLGIAVAADLLRAEPAAEPRVPVGVAAPHCRGSLEQMKAIGREISEADLSIAQGTTVRADDQVTADLLGHARASFGAAIAVAYPECRGTPAERQAVRGVQVQTAFERLDV